jgi:hypothetical protein
MDLHSHFWIYMQKNCNQYVGEIYALLYSLWPHSHSPKHRMNLNIQKNSNRKRKCSINEQRNAIKSFEKENPIFCDNMHKAGGHVK